MNRNMVRTALIAAGVLAFSTASGSAQYYQPGLPNPYHPGYPGYVPPGGLYGNTGGSLMGSAAMANAFGNVITSQEEARVLREKANQAKIDTKRKAFDEMNYEKANTPTWTEQQTKVQKNTATRLMLQAKEHEVISGFAMNYVLPTLQHMVLAGVPGPYLPLDESQLAKINVTVGENGNNLGMFKNGKPTDWPYALLGPTQKKLDAKLDKAIYNARQGVNDPKLQREIRVLNEEMLANLKKKLHAEEIDGSEYLEAKRYQERLTDGISGLSKAYASRMLDGQYRVEGKNVPEVVMNMQRNGLRFAPATPGDEPAYLSLHSAMSAYYQQGHASNTASMFPR
ncbi:MAG: hypothetical protein U0744_06195 [Gemmataceae bacterium]